MDLLRVDIERALDELTSYEEGMRFQGLAVVLGRKRWPELIARQRKKDLGLDAYAHSSLTLERIGKGLAASITPTLKKVLSDAETAKENFPDLGALLFVTPGKVGNADRKYWEDEVQKTHGIKLHIIEREEIITQMMMPENASLCARFLRLSIVSEPSIKDLIDRTRRAASTATKTWANKTKGFPLIDLMAVRLGTDGAESSDVLSLEDIDHALSQSHRIVLEGPAGRGKTTTLTQLAQRVRAAGTAFIVELSAWTSSRRGILDFISGMPAFQAEGLTSAGLARVQQAEPFMFLLNGWNEIAESNSAQANEALRELERDFPSAGIIVATRTHHLTPPLPGALRLRLLRLERAQRQAYLMARLGEKSAEFGASIDADPSLDALTRTPFILSEVASLLECGSEIPSTKIGILAKILRQQERRDEHRNALQMAPIFGESIEYLKAIATEMTRRGSVALPEEEARAVIATIARKLSHIGRIEPVAAPAVLATLTAHNVLERVDYPKTVFQFEHQQLQEYYAALDVRASLIDLQNNGQDATRRFTEDYVNDPAWAEQLRMIAETFSEETGDVEADSRNNRAGENLVSMALAVDLVFAGEIARLCGITVWNKVRTTVGARLRAAYEISDGSLRQHAIAAMLATGADDFDDIIVPLLSGQDQQTRLNTYRLGPDIKISSLGPNWRERIRCWNEEARADFVSEILHHRVDDEVVDLAVEDSSIAVKNAAAYNLIRRGADEALIRVIESMSEQTFDEFARKNADLMPTALRPRAIAALLSFIEASMDHAARLRAAISLLKLGETDLDGVAKDAIAKLSRGDMRTLDPYYIQSALEYLHQIDPTWTNEWVVTQIAEGYLYEHEHWLQFVAEIPHELVDKYLLRLETEDLRNTHIGGMISIIAARPDTNLSARIFESLRKLRRKVDAEPSMRHETERNIALQLENLFRHLPGDIAAAGILSTATSGDPLDIKVTTGVLNRVDRSDTAPLRITDDELKGRLRIYLKDSMNVVLDQDDFSGEEKAYLASSIALVGAPEDMSNLITLIRADIERVSRGRAARASGDRGPLGNGGVMSYAHWHTAAVIRLDPAGADPVLIDLLSEPAYRSEAAAAIARNFSPNSEPSFHRALRYDLIWKARQAPTLPPSSDQRRARFAIAFDAEIKRLLEQSRDGTTCSGLYDLAKALAAVDGRGFASSVLDVISMPDQWNQRTCLDASECLLLAGVVLPSATAFSLIDSIVERTEKWMHNSDRNILQNLLTLCPFVDDPTAGIAKIRDVLGKRQFRGYELGEIVSALGESRSDAAIDLLYELGCDTQTFEQCEEKFIDAFFALDTPRAQDILLGFVNPDIRGITLTRRLHREDLLVARLAELAKRSPMVATSLQILCERDLPEINRQTLSKVMNRIGTPEALAANLNLIDDFRSLPIPQGIWDHLENDFVERRPYGRTDNIFTRHARASNELRAHLFGIAIQRDKRRNSAFTLLGQIELWRLEYGRPTGEPRHPDFASGQSWPPTEPLATLKGGQYPQE